MINAATGSMRLFPPSGVARGDPVQAPGFRLGAGQKKNRPFAGTFEKKFAFPGGTLTEKPSNKKHAKRSCRHNERVSKILRSRPSRRRPLKLFPRGNVRSLPKTSLAPVPGGPAQRGRLARRRNGICHDTLAGALKSVVGFSTIPYTRSRLRYGCSRRTRTQ